MGMENTTKDFKNAFDQLNKEELETLKVFHSYGLDVSLESLSDIEILEKNKNLITYRNKKTNETVTSDLLGTIYEMWHPKYSVSLTTYNPDENLFIEHFHSIAPAKTFGEAGKNALKSRNNPEAKLLSRAYADVSTKYGDFCLSLEEGYEDCKTGPFRSISLYTGNHEEVIYKNGFDFNRFCLFRLKYSEKEKNNRWVVGYKTNDFCGVKRYIWSYEKTNQTGDYSIYGCQKSNTNYGLIFLDGNLSLEENLSFFPFQPFFPINEFSKFEEMDCTSKAYFKNNFGLAAIIKKGNEIFIEYKDKNGFQTQTIYSSTNQEFTYDDFEEIVEKVEDSSINDNLKKIIVSELMTYINIHDRNEFDKISSFTLESHNFESMLECIKQQDLSELVEKGLESLSETLCVDMKDLLGQTLPNQTKAPQYIKKSTNNTNNE